MTIATKELLLSSSALVDVASEISTFRSSLHTFSTDDILGTFSGVTVPEDPTIIDTGGLSDVAPIVDKDGNVLSPIDSEFGYYVYDFLGADPKIRDFDYNEGFAGNILQDLDGGGIADDVAGLAVADAQTDTFKTGLPLGTWSLGLGGTSVKASTEHYNVMSHVLSDQAHPEDPNALYPLDNDLKLVDLEPTGIDGALQPGVLHELHVDELVSALETAIANEEAGTNPQTYNDLDFDRDGVNDTYKTLNVDLDVDIDGDGTVETIQVGGVDLDGDDVADIADQGLNGFGKADIVDLMAPNESSITKDIAYSSDYSVTLKDDGKLLYRWGTMIKRPNDVRMDVKIDLPEEWTRDQDGNGTPDSLEGGSSGFRITRAELVINHDITNNPNDQVRPEDYENEGATGRTPSYYIVQDPDDATNTLWVSPLDSFDGEGTALPSYFKLTETGDIDLSSGGVPVYDPEGNLVGYRNEDESGAFIGTVFRDLSLVTVNEDADLEAKSEDLEEGFTNEFYTSTNRDPFEWSYDIFDDDPNRQVFVGFESRTAAEAAGFTDDALVSGPRWRLTANKFGQDLPGLEVPLVENSEPPFKSDNIKYDTGDPKTTVLNLLDWDIDANGDGVPDASPLSFSAGWMLVDPDRVDLNSDGFIDEGWTAVNGTLGAGDLVPTMIESAITPNGQSLDRDTFDTAVYIKGDRQDTAKLYDMELVIEYDNPVIGAVQQVSGLTHEAQTVAYEGGARFINPIVFATPTTLNSADPATVEFSNIDSNEATLYLEEPRYTDGVNPVGESLTLLTLEEGNWRLDDGSLLQVGTTEVPAGPTDSFHTVTFDEAFDEVPIILLQTQTTAGPQWEVVRAQNVTETGFEVALQEEEKLDGFHTAEVVGWAALDPSASTGVIEWNGIGVQAIDTGETVTSNPTDFAFVPDVGTEPLVSAILASYNGPNTANLRLSDLDDDGTSATAQFIAYEEQSLNSEMAHVAEQVTGLAFEHAGLLTGEEEDFSAGFPFV
ncbi:MAG: hypothetical protein RIC87_06520 [Kiloniellales bacterium]